MFSCESTVLETSSFWAGQKKNIYLKNLNFRRKYKNPDVK